MVVQAKINGVESKALIDTGGVVSFITTPLSERAKVHSYRGAVRLAGFDGHEVVSPVVWTNSLQIGGLTWAGGVEFALMGPPHDDPKLSVALLGMDLLDGRDYDIDFTHHLLTIYSTKNCLHPDPLWDTTSTGVSLERTEHDHKVTLPVAFDADLLDAEIDTGAPTSYLTREGALRAGVTKDALAKDPTRDVPGLNGKRKVRVHRFAQISIGEDVLRNFEIEVDDRPRNDFPVDMIIGLDYISQHHLWLSLSTNAVFIDSGEKKKPAG
jgi:predicted aspartyl protease